MFEYNYNINIKVVIFLLGLVMDIGREGYMM